MFVEQVKMYCEVVDSKQRIVDKILNNDQILSQIDALFGISVIRDWSLVMFNAGRQFKESYLLTVSDGERTGKLVVKFYKRNAYKRFKRETGPRSHPDVIPYAPHFLGVSVSHENTPKNARFEGDDHLMIVEEYVDGEDLINIYQEGDSNALAAATIAEERYHTLGQITEKMGFFLSNVNPRNIRFKAPDDETPKVVDWGGQNVHMSRKAYAQLISRNILGPLL